MFPKSSQLFSAGWAVLDVFDALRPTPGLTAILADGGFNLRLRPGMLNLELGAED